MSENKLEELIHEGLFESEIDELFELCKQDNSLITEAVEKLQKVETDYKYDAAYELSRLGPVAKPVVPLLIEAMNLDDPERCEYVAMHLGDIGVEAYEALPKLIELLQLEIPQLSHEVANVLASIGEKAKDAVPYLIQQFSLGDSELNEIVSCALGSIMPCTEDVFNYGIEEIRKGHYHIIQSIVPNISDIVKNDEQATHFFIEKQKDEDNDVREFAKACLHWCSKEKSEIISAIREVFDERQDM